MKKDLLVTIADQAFIDQAKQLFSSVYWNAGWQGDYMLLAQDIPDDELKWFEEKGILVTRCESLSENERVGDYPSAALAKLHLFTPAFKAWDHVVYLDGDIIVRGSLAHLQTVSGFGARYYPGPLLGQFQELDKRLFGRLRRGFDLRQRCFNAGVLSFQTDIITEDMFQRLLDYSSQYLDHCTFADEGILNLFFLGQCTALPRSFNRLMRDQVALNEERATVLHFNSAYFKPWKKPHPFHEEWSTNLRRAEDIDLSTTQAPQEVSGPEDVPTTEETFKGKLLRNRRYFGRSLKIKHPSIHDILWKIRSQLKRLADLRLAYARFYLKVILISNKLVCDPEADLDLHMVVCRDDVLNCLWAVKTFHHYSGMTFNLVIHEDGSFTDREIRLLKKHFKNCRIVRREEADSRMGHVLKDYPFISKFRAEKSFYCALKLIDPLFYGHADKIITLDSDVLFFRRPDEMIGLVTEGKPFFTSDYMNSYRYPAEILDEVFGMDIYPRFNAGFLHFSRETYLENLGLMEQYFAKAAKLESPFSGINRHEQTLHGILQTRLGGERLGPAYSISYQPITDDTAFHHFVSDFSRETYYSKGLTRLKSKGFLRSLKGRD